MASRTLLRTIGSRWCEIEIEIEATEDPTIPRLSICGSEGRIVSVSEARKMAIAYWESYFDDNRAEIVNMGERFGKRFATARSAARFVVASDGEFHGLDVHKQIGDGRKARVLITDSCGQIVDTIREWFPEYADLLPFHMNDTKAGAPDQEAALSAAPKDWWRALPGGKYGPDFYSHACMALALGGILYSKHDGLIRILGRGTRPARGYTDADGIGHGGYRYGTGWVMTPLPAHVADRLRELFPSGIAA